MTEPNEQQSAEPKYKHDEYTIEQFDALIQEEEEKWMQLGIGLNNMQFTGAELFALQCKLQAITNCIVSGTLDEENLNLHLKAIILESMEAIREGIEPAVRQARIDRLRQNIVPRVQMPWEKPQNGG